MRSTAKCGLVASSRRSVRATPLRAATRARRMSCDSAEKSNLGANQSGPRPDRNTRKHCSVSGGSSFNGFRLIRAQTSDTGVPQAHTAKIDKSRRLRAQIHQWVLWLHCITYKRKTSWS